MATSKVPGTPEEGVEDTESTTASTPRQGRFARMTSDEDVQMVQKTFDFIKPAAKFAGHVGLSILSPTYAARKVATEVIDTTTHFLDSRREKQAAEQTQQ